MPLISANTPKPIVLISGSGPSGLFLALTLAKNGIPVRIIEKSNKFHEGQRGTGAQPRTLEIYHYLGVLDDIVSAEQPIKPLAIYKLPEGKDIVKTVSMIECHPNTPSVPFRNTVIIAQYCAEKILRKHLAELNVVPELATELVDFEQNGDSVTAHLVKHDGDKDVEETVSVDYLVGADGAHSVVRKILGLTFLGETRPLERLIVADIEMKGLSGDYWHSWGDFQTRAVMLRPTERSAVFSLNGGGKDVDVDTVSQSRESLIEYIEDVTNHHDWEFGELKYLSDWKPNVRMVNKLGEGRVFVVGDAAHVHSPTGAQGLNSGAQDAFNLGWKLSLVCKSLAPFSILETYTDERLPVIREMLDRTTKLLDQTLKFNSDGTNAEGFKRPKILHQLGVHCRWSPLVVDEQSEAVEAKIASPYLDEDPSVLFAGDRAPDAPGLRVVARANGAVVEEEETSLFKTYNHTRHTVLLFANGAYESQLQFIVNTVRAAPKNTIQIVVILPKGAIPILSQAAHGADLVVVDTLGHAADAYPPIVKGFSVIVVRPDGVVGAVARGEEGVNEYVDTVFVNTPSLRTVA